MGFHRVNISISTTSRESPPLIRIYTEMNPSGPFASLFPSHPPSPLRVALSSNLLGTKSGPQYRPCLRVCFCDGLWKEKEKSASARAPPFPYLASCFAFAGELVPLGRRMPRQAHWVLGDIMFRPPLLLSSVCAGDWPRARYAGRQARDGRGEYVLGAVYLAESSWQNGRFKRLPVFLCSLPPSYYTLNHNHDIIPDKRVEEMPRLGEVWCEPRYALHQTTPVVDYGSIGSPAIEADDTG